MFININIKGYKEEDVRYAFSADEILIEIRDRKVKRGTNRILRLCQTLSKQIDVPTSNVSFLVDYITFKLAKAEKSSNWPNLGYDIAEWTNPLRGQMKSNFAKSLAQPKPEPAAEAKAEIKTEQRVSP